MIVFRPIIWICNLLFEDSTKKESHKDTSSSRPPDAMAINGETVHVVHRKMQAALPFKDNGISRLIEVPIMELHVKHTNGDIFVYRFDENETKDLEWKIGNNILER